MDDPSRSPYLYLASQSPRRRQLLEQIGVRHELLLPGDEEDAEALEVTRPGEPPARYVQRVTLAKLQAACERHRQRGLPEAPVLCADTTVALGRDILGKPADAEDACRTLGRLSGQEHRVLTAVALAWGPGLQQRRLLLVRSRGRFMPLTDTQITAYVRGGQPMGKAGAYAIQSEAAAWIEAIQGSYSGIMGLPLYETAELLRGIGWRL